MTVTEEEALVELRRDLAKVNEAIELGEKKEEDLREALHDVKTATDALRERGSALVIAIQEIERIRKFREGGA